MRSEASASDVWLAPALDVLEAFPPDAGAPRGHEAWPSSVLLYTPGSRPSAMPASSLSQGRGKLALGRRRGGGCGTGGGCSGEPRRRLRRLAFRSHGLVRLHRERTQTLEFVRNSFVGNAAFSGPRGGRRWVEVRPARAGQPRRTWNPGQPLLAVRAAAPRSVPRHGRNPARLLVTLLSLAANYAYCLLYTSPSPRDS